MDQPIHIIRAVIGAGGVLALADLMLLRAFAAELLPIGIIAGDDADFGVGFQTVESLWVLSVEK